MDEMSNNVTDERPTAGGPNATAGAEPRMTPDRGEAGVAPRRPLDGLGFVMDVPVELTVEIGRKTLRISDILKLGPGSVLELDKSSGEPLDIFANGRLIAKGEAVVVGERYGVRLTEVLVLSDSRSGGLV
jgi:flagellar motor switch protein FliN/FliY